jgi:dynein heavy chain 2
VFFVLLEIQSWIVCDGDVDPEWVESLNSVLDDNRLLTMPSGERIQFGPNVNFLFETHDLSCASPATISRMGMIFLRFYFYIQFLFLKELSSNFSLVMKIQMSKQ